MIRGFHTTAIGQVKFSPNGKLLLSVGVNATNGIAVHKWATGTLVAATPTHCSRVFMAAFRPESNEQVRRPRVLAPATAYLPRVRLALSPRRCRCRA